MIDGMFVFDNAIHVYDMSDANLTDRDDSVYSRDLLLSAGAAGRWSAYNDGKIEFGRRWSIEEVYEMVFVDAPTDMAMVQVVPVFDWYVDAFSPIKTQWAMAQKYPDRVLLCGGVDPVHMGVEGALEQIEHQVRDLGAVSMKFYNAHVDESWSCDDERVAYPLYEKCRAMGLKNIQFHKGLPFGKMRVEDLSPVDLQRPARDFPDLNFIIHHLALPYFDEVVNIAARFPNVYLSLGGNINAYLIQPRLVQEQLGRLLMEVGAAKLLWASDAALSGGPAPYLDAFLDLDIPDDLRRGYGYPQITREDRAMILGQNFARLMGVDVDAKLAALQSEWA